MRIGIDIDEIVRNRWMVFDKYYASEFGDDVEPKYTLNLFEDYKWKDTSEEVKILREDAPEEISPIDYQLNDEGESNADPFLFSTETVFKTAKENFEEFLYTDYLLEIFGHATKTEKQLELNLFNLIKKYKEHEFVLFSNNKLKTIQPTLFFCSKFKLPFKKYEFFDNIEDIVESYDMVISTNTSILDAMKNANKKYILAKRPYNENYECDKSIILINDLLDDELINDIKEKE